MSRPERGSKWGIPWLVLPLGGILTLVVFGQSLADPELFDPGPPSTAAQAVEVPATELSDVAPEAVSRPPDRTSALRLGDTLGGVLQRLGLTSDEAFQAALASSRFIDLRQLRAGTPWSAYLDEQGRLERLDLQVADRGEFRLVRDGDSWSPAWRDYRRETRIRMINGVLEGSFEGAIAEAGAPPELAYDLAEVLQWDLDFSRDLRVGDEFAVLFEEVTIEGQGPRPERILAVSYGQARRPRLEAYFYRQGDRAGYYDASGRPLQKMFLRSPLPYSRITSRFTNRRFHPVLGRYMPHHGVDYGAPTGTPVRVTASGTVAWAGWKGGGGRTIEVRHPNGYLTGYLHLSRIAPGIQKGARVQQGQVIGYVGATGLATAPHLDYRVQVNGHWIDPLSLKSVPAQPIPSSEMAEYFAVRDAMRASLESGNPYTPPIVVASRGAQVPASAPRSSSTGR